MEGIESWSCFAEGPGATKRWLAMVVKAYCPLKMITEALHELAEPGSTYMLTDAWSMGSHSIVFLTKPTDLGTQEPDWVIKIRPPVKEDSYEIATCDTSMDRLITLLIEAYYRSIDRKEPTIDVKESKRQLAKASYPGQTKDPTSLAYFIHHRKHELYIRDTLRGEDAAASSTKAEDFSAEAEKEIREHRRGYNYEHACSTFLRTLGVKCVNIQEMVDGLSLDPDLNLPVCTMLVMPLAQGIHVTDLLIQGSAKLEAPQISIARTMSFAGLGISRPIWRSLPVFMGLNEGQFPTSLQFPRIPGSISLYDFVCQRIMYRFAEVHVYLAQFEYDYCRPETHPEKLKPPHKAVRNPVSQYVSNSDIGLDLNVPARPGADPEAKSDSTPALVGGPTADCNANSNGPNDEHYDLPSTVLKALVELILKKYLGIVNKSPKARMMARRICRAFTKHLDLDEQQFGRQTKHFLNFDRLHGDNAVLQPTTLDVMFYDVEYFTYDSLVHVAMPPRGMGIALYDWIFDDVPDGDKWLERVMATRKTYGAFLKSACSLTGVSEKVGVMLADQLERRTTWLWEVLWYVMRTADENFDGVEELERFCESELAKGIFARVEDANDQKFYNDWQDLLAFSLKK